MVLGCLLAFTKLSKLHCYSKLTQVLKTVVCDSIPTNSSAVCIDETQSYIFDVVCAWLMCFVPVGFPGILGFSVVFTKLTFTFYKLL